MRISDLSIDGFGVWHDLDLRRLSPEITVFHGLNEAGKTTLMQFLRSVLYGISGDRRQCYLPPLEGGRPGGTLGMVTDEGPFRVSRFADRDSDFSTSGDIGRVTVELPDGTQQGDRLLREAIEHVDEPTFNNVFAIGLDEIQHLGTLGGSEAAQWIYRLTSGLDRISLYDVIQGLRSSRRRLLGEGPTLSELSRLTSEKEQLESQIAELAGQTRTWCQRGVEVAEIDDRVAELRKELRDRERRARRVEVAMGIRPQWATRLDIDGQIQSLHGLFSLEKTAIGELDELNDRIEEHERQRDIHKGQRHQLRQEAEQLGINEVLVKNCCRVEGLAEQQEWLESLAQQSKEQKAEADRLADRFGRETSRLAQQWFNDPKRRLVLTTEQIEQLAPQRTAMESARKQLSAAEGEFEGYRSEEEKHRAQLDSATTSSEKMGLPTDLQSAGELVARLRRRLSVEQKIEQTRRSGVELEQQARDMLDGQVLPLRLYVFWGACVFGAAAMIATWALSGDRPEFGQAGAVLAVISLAIPFFRWANEARVADELDGVHRQIETLNRQLAESRAEKEQLDEDLPVADGSVVLRLQTAERHLADLEEILPIESDRRRATEASRTAKREYETARERMATSERDWRGQLKALGLPEALTPKELNLLAGQYEQLAQLETQAQNRRDETERRQREFDRIVGRITRLAQESSLVVDGASPLEQLEHLLAENRLQKAHLTHRDKLRESAKELKAEEARHARAAIGLTRKRESLFQRAGVDHETAFRKLAADLAECERLQEERTSLTREIIAAIGALGEEDDFAPFFLNEALAGLDAEWKKLTADHEEVEQELELLLEERARLVEQQRLLADDDSLADRQIELGIVEAKIDRATQAWRERATVSRMLEHVRHDYEQNRQPETLLEATEYFRELTGGSYTRIWTPLANDVLFVDREDGQSLAVDSLSRGTREQLFLSVRLAVVAMFARRGIQLPMILDDVLVNYDEQRAALAAKVLCKFASQGHQLMIFTCHEHILAIFKKLSADCRRLPSRTGELIKEAPERVEIVEEVKEIEVVKSVEVEPEPEPEVIEEFVYEEETIEPEPEPVDFTYAAGILPRAEPEPPAYEPKPTAPPIPVAPPASVAPPTEIEYDWQHDDPRAFSELDRFKKATPPEPSRFDKALAGQAGY